MPLYIPPSILIQDEATPQGSARTLNFEGAGVSVAVVSDVATVTIPGGGGGGGSATRIVVSLPYPTRRTSSVIVTDGTVSPTSKILVWFSGLADSDVNSSMEDSAILKAVAGTGNFLLRIESRQPLAGNLSFDYMVLP